MLSPEQRRCIELAFFEGLTHTQIAERLEAPLGTVKSRILLGMNKLRQALST
ncbi:MAG TPA: sigma factor-like helix-turn-helix DNA-binding protein [Thermoanaerobaculia bacterium]|nr:sigma factor-like helix-turn-helix DNA-binding protein [Thermoanaerobaculia bacterium]